MKIILIVSLLFIFAVSAFAQTDQPKQDLICVEQSVINECAKRALEGKALRDENAFLKEARANDQLSKDELKQANQKLQIEVAKITGQLTESEKARNSQLLVIELLLKYPRKKFSLIDIF